LTTVNIPDNLVSIGEGAFYTCESLTSIIIPNGVTKIAKNTFFKCYALKTVVVPQSVTVIDFYAFEFCHKLTNVYYGGSATDWAKVDVNNGNGYFVYAPLYYYSETEPTDDGNYWHYDTDGKTPIIWEK